MEKNCPLDKAIENLPCVTWLKTTPIITLLMEQPRVCPPVLREVKSKPVNKISSKSITSPVGFPQVPTTSGFKLVKQNRFAKIYKRNKEKSPPKTFFWICE